MNIWEKIKQDFFGGVATASEKASELIKSGTDTLKLGIEKTSLKATYASKLAQLNAKERSLNNDMENQFCRTGEILFMLQSENRLVDIEKEAGANFETLSSLETELQEIQHAKAELDSTCKLEILEKESMQELTKNLEEGGGTIMQIRLEEGSATAGMPVKDLQLPEQVLLGAIVRDEDFIVPDGETVLLPGDKITLLGKKGDVEQTIKLMAHVEDV